MKKIQDIYLENIIKEKNIKNIFGDWINNIENVKNEFNNNTNPFNYVKIENFLNQDYIDIVEKNFPMNLDKWHKYSNPIEVKYANDNINSFHKSIKDVFYILSSEELISIFRNITNIDNLEYDPYLHGAGLHAHPKYGRLNLHLDYEKHPILENKERRLNIILFLSKNWKKEWNGDNQLWDRNVEKCITKTYPIYNTAIIFKTNNESWHGMPDKVLCPENVFRKSLAYYYISPLTNKPSTSKYGDDGSGYRTKAAFIKRPNDPNCKKMEKLYKIRPHRRISKEDMEKIWPDWNYITD